MSRHKSQVEYNDKLFWKNLYSTFDLLSFQQAEQLNCTKNPGMCPVVCNEPVPGLPYSSTFCDSTSGSCVCDCRTVSLFCWHNLLETYSPNFCACIIMLKHRIMSKCQFVQELKSSCEEVPFTECFQDCVRKNPNPDVYLYKGGNCPVVSPTGSKAFQCACECSLRDDYIETNDIF